MSERTIYTITITTYLVSRLILFGLGIQMVVMPAFMHFLDPELLVADFWEAIIYMHTFPPLMNGLYGILLLSFGESAHLMIHFL